MKQVNSNAEWLMVVVTKRKVKLALDSTAAIVSCECFHSRYLCDTVFDCLRAVYLSAKFLHPPVSLSSAQIMFSHHALLLSKYINYYKEFSLHKT